ncbi:hypothetical protein [Psychrobacter fozii]|uniref:Uncharacterized protein n=1 Tax=Psychrobacter fozii TaxID=198480 RepID=A0A2V4V134_9GAMM|nr:hypothetical protein [Psychrobacter fozii]PYE39762.1 hypothetical protein DFP82_103210 [Psychrobacter fozii]
MYKSIKNAFLIAASVACTSTLAASQNENFSTAPSLIKTPEQKAQVLTEKALKADLIYSDFQDKEFLESTIFTIDNSLNKSEIECAVNKADFNYKRNLYEILLEYVNKHPEEATDLWLENLDFLARVNSKIVNYPDVVDFNIDDLPASSALNTMTDEESLKLQSVILDPRFSKLLPFLGLPTLDKNNQLVNSFSLSVLYSAAIMKASTDECKGN